MLLYGLINKDYQHQLEDTMTSLSFPWFFNKWVDEYPFNFKDENVVEN